MCQIKKLNELKEGDKFYFCTANGKLASSNN